MPFEELITLLKKKGFRETFQVLINAKNYKLEMHSFYEELLKFSYYNSFFRIKDQLIEKELLNEDRSNGKRYYSLTKKGSELYEKLAEIERIISSN